MTFTKFKWEISDKKYLSFVNAKHQQEFSSSLFEVDNIKFYLKCFPNGRKKPGLVNLYLTLSEEHFPPNIAKLKINYWIFCAQTHSRMSDIRDFSNDDNNSFHGWSTNTLNLKELENNSVHDITFTVGVNILKIYFKNEVAKGSDINNDALPMNKPLIYEKPFKMLPKNTFNWNINEFMFQSFLSAVHKKCWESQQFGQWALGCYPNGHTKTDKGNAMLYLKCLGLPPQIYGVKIRYTLYSPQINLKWSYVQNYNYANTNYANATFKTSTLHSLKSLSFQITINILKLYDLNRKEVPYRDIHKYLLIKPNSDDQKMVDYEWDTFEDTEDTLPLIPNIDIVGIAQGIKDRLMDVARYTTELNAKEKTQPNISEAMVENTVRDSYEISSVQEQVEIYSKELQSMNREIYSVRKQCTDMSDRQRKMDTSFETVLKQVKMIKNEMSEVTRSESENETYAECMRRIESLESEVSALRNELNAQKGLRQEMEVLRKDYSGMSLDGSKMMQEIISLRDEMNEIKKENEEIKKSNFSLVSITNDENKTNDESESERDKEKIKEMKEWVFTKLEFNNTVLNSIWQKLINDGFDDISLLCELNDDTLKQMGIHRVGDRIKILRACKQIKL